MKHRVLLTTGAFEGDAGMVPVYFVLAGVLIGLAIGYFFWGLGTQTGQTSNVTGGIIDVKDVERRILDLYSAYEKGTLDKDSYYSIVQLVTMYYGIIYNYENVDFNLDTLLAAAALEYIARDIVTLPFQLMNRFPETGCSELLKAILYARVKQVDMAANAYEKSKDCHAPGVDVLREYYQKLISQI